MLFQIQTVSDEVSDLRALVAKDEDPVAAVPAVAAVPPTQCDSQQTQGNVAVSRSGRCWGVASWFW